MIPRIRFHDTIEEAVADEQTAGVVDKSHQTTVGAVAENATKDGCRRLAILNEDGTSLNLRGYATGKFLVASYLTLHRQVGDDGTISHVAEGSQRTTFAVVHIQDEGVSVAVEIASIGLFSPFAQQPAISV